MIITLLVIIILILLFGAAAVKNVAVKVLLLLACAIPVIFLGLKLIQHPEIMLGLAVAFILAGIGFKSWEFEKRDADARKSFDLFESSINTFAPDERRRVMELLDKGDVVAFRNACRQIIRAIEKRERHQRGLSKDEKRALKAQYLRNTSK